MDIRFIAFGMVIVLILLFVGAQLYIPKEKSKTKWEAEYASAAQDYFRDSSADNYKRCKDVLEKHFGNDNPRVLSRLQKDNIQIPS